MVLPRIIRFGRPLLGSCTVGCLFGVASNRLDNAYRFNNAYRLYRRLSWRALLPHCRALGFTAVVIFGSVQAYWLLLDHLHGLRISGPHADDHDTQLDERTSSYMSHRSARTSSPVSSIPCGTKKDRTHLSWVSPRDESFRSRCKWTMLAAVTSLRNVATVYS